MHFPRESIFANAIRSFCTSFSTLAGALVGVIVIVILAMMFLGSNYLPPKSEPLIMPDAQGNRELLPLNTPVILRIDFHGVIGMGDLTGEKIQNILLDSREDMFKEGRVKAILLHMNTPGGTVTDADDIYRALLNYKAKYNVPIYVYVDGLCASGGMYIASAADKIYSSPAGTIGSIGVIMGPTFNFSDLMAKWGVSSLTLTEGKDKDALNPFRPWKPGEEESLKAITSAMYERFVNIVVAARPKLNKQKLVDEYGAHVFIAKEAEELGYVDVAGVDCSRALTALAHAAGIEENSSYQVMLLTPPRPLFPDLSQANSKKMVHTVDLGPYMSPELAGKFLYLYQP